MKEIFSNIGEKIKLFAQIIFYSNLVALIAGVIAIMVTYSEEQQPVRGLLIAMIVLAVGLLMSLFIPLLIYGFGIIVSNHEVKELELNAEITDNTKKVSECTEPQENTKTAGKNPYKLW